MNDEQYVLEALQSATLAAVAASSDATLAVKYAGLPINPPSSGKWLEVIQIPNNFERDWGSEKVYQGLLRLLLHWPIDGQGAYPPMNLLKSISSYFYKGRKLKDSGNNIEVVVLTNPDFMGILEEPPEVVYPVSIRYRCYVR